MEELEQEECECCGEPLSDMTEIRNGLCNKCLEEIEYGEI